MKTTPFASTQEALPLNSPVGDRDDRGAGRLVVLVPDVWETALLAGRIHQVAEARRQDVLLFGMVSELQPEAAMRRKLTLLSAFLHEAGTRAEIRVKEGRVLIFELESLLAAGDLLACCGTDRGPGSAEQWADMLGNRFRRPIYVFTDGGMVQAPAPGFLVRLAPWFGSVAIILGFLWLQVLLSRVGGAISTNAWLFGSVPAEIGLIWLLNALIG